MLQVLASLSQTVGDLLYFLENVNNKTIQTLEADVAAGKPLGDFQKKVANDKTPTASLQKSIKNRLTRVKKCALEINALSGVYGSIIAQVVNPAWNMAIRPSEYDCSTMNGRQIADMKNREMLPFMEQARGICQTAGDQARNNLHKKMALIDGGEAEAP